MIVVNDGSTDATDEITREYGFRLISTENRGLSSARNAGLEAATGEIVAYIDADARPDPHWLCHLATAFLKSSHAGIGGPNIPPPDDGETAECVANAPGGPIHVLLSDEIAEHIPGCNMAFWKTSLEAIGGFDPQFRIAGDDVDICWRLQDQGWTVGFSPGAVVWHHRRGSRARLSEAAVRVRQGGGAAGAQVARALQPRGAPGLGRPRLRRAARKGARRAAGRSTTAPGAPACSSPCTSARPGILGSLPLMPEWYLVIALLAGLSLLGIMWTPLLLAVPLLIAAVGVARVQVRARRRARERHLRRRIAAAASNECG